MLRSFKELGLLLWVGLLVIAPTGGHAQAPRQGSPTGRKTVVVLFSLPQDVPGLRELSAGISEGLQKDSPVPLDIYTEYTGLDRFTGPTYEAGLLTLYTEKFSARKVDLLMVVGPTALEWVVAKQFLPRVPVVACYTPQRNVEAARLHRPELTGALSARNAPLTIDLMLSMFPRTRRIHVVLGASAYERNQAQMGRLIFKTFAGRVDLEYLNDLTLEQIETRVAHLPDEDLVLYGSLLQDASGRDFTTNEGIARISAASRRPVFGVVAEDLGEGILGGVLLSMELSGKAAGMVGRRILSGESAASIPLVADTGVAPMFDWRQLKRWGIRENRLPPGAMLRFREVSLWDAYWREISLALGIMALESLLVAGLVIQLRRRKRSERALAGAQERYRTVADFTHDWEFWQRPDGSYEYSSPACEGLTGHPPEAFRENPGLMEQLVLPEDRPAWQAHQAKVLAGQPTEFLEYRIRTKGGEFRWVQQDDNPVHLFDGVPAGNRGSIRDISAAKRSFEEIKRLKDQLEAENTYYREKIQAVAGSDELLGQSDKMKYLLFRIRQVAPSDATVLIEGETGTGKELVAEAIHKLGPRKHRPLIKINCAALPPALAESELFGHERGAFTGAQTQRKGRFELADEATLFLDEVGELPLELQAKLLRVIQDGQFQRVGGDRTLKVDVRLIAATNRDLSREVATGRFREDLYYRLNGFPITVPPLRDRKDDIPLLAQAFLERVCHKLGRSELALSHSVIQALQDYEWPGNVRELQNVIQRSVLDSDGFQLRLADHQTSHPLSGVSKGPGFLQSLEDLERSHIIRVLEATQWKVQGAKGAAQVLGLKPSTLRFRMTKLGIERPTND
jgi:PAS domain S-box-containing protein